MAPDLRADGSKLFAQAALITARSWLSGNALCTELRETVASNESKRKKWDKAKAIFTFAMDKGIDGALAFLPMMNFLK